VSKCRSAWFLLALSLQSQSVKPIECVQQLLPMDLKPECRGKFRHLSIDRSNYRLEVDLIGSLVLHEICFRFLKSLHRMDRREDE